MVTKRARLRYWLPPLLWTCVILLASSDAFSAANSGPWLQTIITSILGHSLPKQQFNVLHFVLRKASHLTEYGILGALLFRALRADGQRWNVRWSVAAVAIAAAVASIDEWHQTFVPSRTGAFSDVLLDTAGATLAQILIRVAQVLFF
jgi:VanZ family protein